MEKVFYYCNVNTSYPVGTNIASAIENARGMANAFNSIKEFEGFEINIFCRGSSGAILAALFSSFIVNKNCHVFHIKKEGESSHQQQNDIDPSFTGITLLIDDFVCSGSTLRAIIAGIPLKNRRIDCLVLASYGFSSNDHAYDSLGYIPTYQIERSSGH